MTTYHLIPQSRGGLFLDVLACSLWIILPMLSVSIIAAKKRRFRLHKILQTLIAVIMTFVLGAFEFQMRTTGWRQLAEDSVYYDTWVMPALILHLLFAVPTFILWVLTLRGAYKNFVMPHRHCKYSIIHKRMGRLAVYLSFGTGLTGWMFYWLAFIA